MSLNYIWKAIKAYWWLVLLSFPVWFALVWAWGYFGIDDAVAKLSLEAVLSLGFSFATGFVAALNGRMQQRKNKIDAEMEILRGLIAFNNEAMIDTSRRLEDAIDGVTLELRRLDNFGLQLAELRSHNTSHALELSQLVAEQERQKERLLQGDRLLHAMDLIASCIKTTEQIRCEIESLKQKKEQK